MLETITKDEMIKYYNSTFLSTCSKRLDIELAASAHAEEQTKSLAENSTHEVFTSVMKR